VEYATLVVMLALVEYIWFTARTGLRRGKYKIEAPATTGNLEFEKAFRVQQNTLEQMIVFIPAAFAFAWYVSGPWVLLPGALFIVGRLMYASAYLGDPKKRLPGMIATMLANAAMVIAVLVRVVAGLA
jgi:glutathione S-transferase